MTAKQQPAAEISAQMEVEDTNSYRQQQMRLEPNMHKYMQSFFNSNKCCLLGGKSELLLRKANKL